MPIDKIRRFVLYANLSIYQNHYHGGKCLTSQHQTFALKAAKYAILKVATAMPQRKVQTTNKWRQSNRNLTRAVRFRHCKHNYGL